MVKLLVTRKRVTPKFITPKFVTPKTRFAGIVFLFSCFLVAVFFLIFKSDFLTVKNVNCWVKEKTSIADEERWCGAVKRELQGQKILYPKTQAVASQIGHRFLPVGEVKITKKYPRTVLVQIIERKPMAKVCPPGGRDFVVDKEGVIYSEIYPESQDLSRVVLELGTELELGQKLEPEIVGLLLLEDPKISLIKYIGQQGIGAQTSEQLTIFFSREKNLESQIRSLQMIVKKYRIEGKVLKLVDLRYDQPVVKY